MIDLCYPCNLWLSASTFHAAKLISQIKLQRSFQDFGADVFRACLDRAVARLHRNLQRQLRLTHEHEWIHLLIDRALHKHRHKRIRYRIHTFEVYALDVDIAVNRLLVLIERQFDLVLGPTLELHTTAGEVVAPCERHGRIHIAVAKLHARLDAAALRQQRNRVRTSALEQRLLDPIVTISRLPELERWRAESVERRREHGVDKTLLQ